MRRWLCWMRTKLRAIWRAAHLKDQGQYSVSRLRALDRHLRTATTTHSMLAVLLTPLPALIVIAGTDLFTLAAPHEGYQSNALFLVRAWMLSTAMIGILMLQLSIFLPGLNMKKRDIALLTLFTSTTASGLMAAMASAIGFPLPFTITLVSPYTATCLCTCTALRYGRQLLRDETLRRQLLEYGLFLTLQYTVTLVYPVFAFVFTQVESVVVQTLLACLLPLVKLVIKVVMSRAMPSLPELRPAFLMFNVEVFNALFIASCLQNASSVATTIAIMTLDSFYNALTLRDVSQRLNALRNLVLPAGTTHDAGKQTIGAVDFIDYAVYFLRDEHIGAAVIGIHGAVPPRIHVQGFAQVVPTATTTLPQPTDSKPADSTIGAIASSSSTSIVARPALDQLASEQKVALVRGVLELLYFTEYVILTEYVEVVVPAIYAVFLSIVYELPNHAYYPQLRNVTATQNTVAVQRVLVYVALELVSFLLFQRLLRRHMKLEPLRQLGFVLAEHWWFLPGKLMLWVAFILQCSIEHFGVDYTFQFKWLARAGATAADQHR